MPLYSRHCNECDEIFEVTCKIAERDFDVTCPFCDATDGEWRPTAPMLSRHSERLMTHRQDKGFQEVLDKVKERNPRTPLASGRNSGGIGLDFTPSK